MLTYLSECTEGIVELCLGIQVLSMTKSSFLMSNIRHCNIKVLCTLSFEWCRKLTIGYIPQTIAVGGLHFDAFEVN